MNDIDLFLQLPLTAQAALICFAVCASGLFVILLAAPRRDCFIFSPAAGNTIARPAGLADAAHCMAGSPVRVVSQIPWDRTG